MRHQPHAGTGLRNARRGGNPRTTRAHSWRNSSARRSTRLNDASASVFVFNKLILPHFGTFRNILSPIRCFHAAADHPGRSLGEKGETDEEANAGHIKVFGAPGRPARSRECKSLTVKV